MDPSRNDMPLEFNRNKGKPPMVYTHSDGDEISANDVTSSTVSAAIYAAATAAAASTNTIMNTNHYSMPPIGNGNMEMADSNSSIAGNMMAPIATLGHIGPMGPSPMIMGPVNMGQFGNMMGALGPMPPMGLMGPGPGGMGGMGPGPGDIGMGMAGMGPPLLHKEIITLTSCVLYPPHPDAPPHSVRERPPGCRTAFVGGLPENITEEILHEVFERCSQIETIRLGKKNFAHIRFINHDAVEHAIYLSGFRMKIENKDDKPNTGRLHVDYANARNDQHEWACEQRAMAREMRHQQQIQEERLRVPSPPPVAPFTVFDGNALLEVIKSDSGFMKAAPKLIAWLDRGSVDKRSSSLFYSLIQSSNTHVRRLLLEKQQHAEEVNQAKLLFKQRVQGILVQLGQIERIFAASLKQKNWDHFTKAQRKNIDSWYKQVQEVKTCQQAEFLNERNEDEMDLSDTEGEGNEPAGKKLRTDDDEGAEGSSTLSSEISALKEENDSLKCQLAAYMNEGEMVKLEAKHTTEALERQITSLQNALKGMQQQLISQQAQMRRAQEEAKTSAADRLDRRSPSHGSKEEGTENEGRESSGVPEPPISGHDTVVSSSGICLKEKEIWMLGLISCFLNVHPNGASVDYLWSYLSQMMTIRPREVEDLLDRLPSLFRQEVAGCGATLERRWFFTGYQKTS